MGYLDIPRDFDHYKNIRSLHINGFHEGETIMIEDLIANLQIPEGKILHRQDYWGQLSNFIK